MGRSMFILVSDDEHQAEQARAFAHANDVNVKIYSTDEWKQGLQDTNFCEQLAGEVPELTEGNNPVEGGAKILSFPYHSSSTSRKVKTLNELESVAIENAIHEFNGNLTEAAKALGIGRATLYRKVKQYNLDTASARKKQKRVA